jgi:hypothetical protein
LFGCIIIETENPKSQRKWTTDGKLIDKTCTVLVVPCNFNNNFHILQTNNRAAYQVSEPLRGINGAALPPFIVG